MIISNWYIKILINIKEILLNFLDYFETNQE